MTFKQLGVDGAIVLANPAFYLGPSNIKCAKLTVS